VGYCWNGYTTRFCGFLLEQHSSQSEIPPFTSAS
jgi:hypothetical protein